MYFESIKNNNITYSIDMLRLTRITYSDFSKLEFFFNNVFTDNIVIKQYTSSKFSDFMFNFVIECEEGSFWFGFLHNSEKRNFADDYLYNFTIEFNPNKLKYNKFVVQILHSFSDWRLRSFDLAMDLPVNILDIIDITKI